MTTISERAFLARFANAIRRVSGSGLQRRRAALIKDCAARKKTATRAREISVRDRKIESLARDLYKSRQSIDEVLPVYVRASELDRHHYGRHFAFTVAFSPDSFIRSLKEIEFRRGPDPADVSQQIYFLSENAARKIEKTMLDEVGKQFGFPGGR